MSSDRREGPGVRGGKPGCWVWSPLHGGVGSRVCTGVSAPEPWAAHRTPAVSQGRSSGEREEVSHGTGLVTPPAWRGRPSGGHRVTGTLLLGLESRNLRRWSLNLVVSHPGSFLHLFLLGFVQHTSPLCCHVALLWGGHKRREGEACVEMFRQDAQMGSVPRARLRD